MTLLVLVIVLLVIGLIIAGMYNSLVQLHSPCRFSLV